MKKILTGVLAIVICCTTSLAASLEKTLSHTFSSADSRGTMSIDSRYGNITVVEWDKAHAEVSARITVKSKSENDARRRLDGINIAFSDSGNSASAKTEIKIENFRNTEFTITYTVNIPKGMKLDVVNKYGNLVTGNLEGRLTATVKYGNVTAGELNARGNRLDVQYGNVDIVNIPELELTIKYGKLSARNIASLTIDSKYSTIKAGYTGTLEIKGSAYDNYSVTEAVTVRARSGMGGIEIGRLHKTLELSGVKYGNVKVDAVSDGFESINITSSYATIDLSFDNPVFGYDLSSRYGNINLIGFPHTASSSGGSHTSQKVKGTAGDHTGGGATVDISASYGNINLRKN